MGYLMHDEGQSKKDDGDGLEKVEKVTAHCNAPDTTMNTRTNQSQ